MNKPFTLTIIIFGCSMGVIPSIKTAPATFNGSATLAGEKFEHLTINGSGRLTDVKATDLVINGSGALTQVTGANLTINGRAH
jgi:hypothetical protein